MLIYVLFLLDVSTDYKRHYPFYVGKLVGASIYQINNCSKKKMFVKDIKIFKKVFTESAEIGKLKSKKLSVTSDLWPHV